MTQISKDFFQDGKVVFMGYSSKPNSFSHELYKAFDENGVKVFPVNPAGKAASGVPVFKNLSELPEVPKTAYVLLNNSHVPAVVDELHAKGVNRILFQNKSVATDAVQKLCADKGIEAKVACPMMLFGGGLHTVHAFFAGVKRV